jgi:hypothetical protein
MVTTPKKERIRRGYHLSKPAQLRNAKPEPIDPSIHRPHRKDLMKTILQPHRRDPFAPLHSTNPVTIAMDLPQIPYKGSLVPVRPRPTLPTNYLHFLQEYNTFLPELQQHDLEQWISHEIAVMKTFGLKFEPQAVEELTLPPLKKQQNMFASSVEGVEAYNYSIVKQFSSKDDRNLRRELLRRQRAMVDIKAAWYRNVVEKNQSQITLKASQTFSTRNVPFMLELLQKAKVPLDEGAVITTDEKKEDDLIEERIKHSSSVKSEKEERRSRSSTRGSIQGEEKLSTPSSGRKSQGIPLARIIETWNDTAPEAIEDSSRSITGITGSHSERSVFTATPSSKSSRKVHIAPHPSEAPDPRPETTETNVSNIPKFTLSKNVLQVLARLAKECPDEETTDQIHTSDTLQKVKKVITGGRTLTDAVEQSTVGIVHTLTGTPAVAKKELKRSKKTNFRDISRVMQRDIVRASTDDITGNICKFVKEHDESTTEKTIQVGGIFNPLAAAEFELSDQSDDDNNGLNPLFTVFGVDRTVSPTKPVGEGPDEGVIELTHLLSDLILTTCT